MTNFPKQMIVSLLQMIRRFLSALRFHAIPRPPGPPPGTGLAYQYFKEDEIRDCYHHFKKYFYDAVFLNSGKSMRKYAIGEALSNHQPGYFYLEFGVYTGNSLNQFSKILGDIKIYGFDSFEGLKEDMIGGYPDNPKGQFNRNKQPPHLNTNCVPVVGWIQDTLPVFISETPNLKINFVHIDTDTYPTTKFLLQEIKPHLVDGSILIFDEFYNFPGWRVGEFRAFNEVFDEDEYVFLAFSINAPQVVIQYNKVSAS